MFDIFYNFGFQKYISFSENLIVQKIRPRIALAVGHYMKWTLYGIKYMNMSV